MSDLNVYGEIAAQRGRLMNQGLEPIIVRFSQATHDNLADSLGARQFGNLVRFMDLEVSIDNGLPYGVVRVLGAYK